MPCSKGLRSCRRDCLHRKSVLEYRDGHDAWEAAKESEEFMNLEESDFKNVYPEPNFKAWLIGKKGENMEPDDGGQLSPSSHSPHEDGT